MLLNPLKASQIISITHQNLVMQFAMCLVCFVQRAVLLCMRHKMRMLILKQQTLPVKERWIQLMVQDLTFFCRLMTTDEDISRMYRK